MFDVEKSVLIAFIIIALISPVLGGASCQGGTDTIRTVHVGVRDAFVRADGFVAARFDSAGDECIERAQNRGLTGESGMTTWRDCMEVWLQLDQAIAATREAMSELENVYDSVEAGQSGEDDWRFWARQVLTHGQTVLSLLDELDIGGVDEVVSSMSQALDQICALVGCGGSQS